MDASNLPLAAGIVSSGLFVSSHIPMLVKAFRTSDLTSYSLANLVLTNLGNGLYWLYIVTLPFGPIWFLHLFYSATMVLMLVWYLRHSARPQPSARALRANTFRKGSMVWTTKTRQSSPP